MIAEQYWFVASVCFIAALFIRGVKRIAWNHRRRVTIRARLGIQ
jgi:hypothetical protein